MRPRIKTVTVHPVLDLTNPNAVENNNRLIKDGYTKVMRVPSSWEQSKRVMAQIQPKEVDEQTIKEHCRREMSNIFAKGLDRLNSRFNIS